MKEHASALNYLLEQEWSMGTGAGQCPECCGVSENWLGHPLFLTSKKIGHKADCKMAAAIASAGGKPLMIGEMNDQREFETFIADSGCFSTRPKTPEGCARLRAWNDALDRKVYNALLSREGSASKETKNE